MVFTALNVFFLACLAGLALALITLYNHLSLAFEEVKKAFASVDTLLAQRRAELPNLAELCRANAEFEKVHERLAVLRSRCEGAPLDLRLDAENIFTALFMQALGRAEAYPELASLDRLRELQARIADLETRIAARRTYFNDAATGYNTWISQFPQLFLARPAGFRRIPLLSEAPRQ